MSLRKSAWCLVFVLMSGCAATGSRDPATRIIGSWQTELAGFAVTTVYTADSVSVEGSEPQAYALEEDLLVVSGDTTTARRISFPARDLMHQTDPMTGTVHIYTRRDP